MPSKERPIRVLIAKTGLDAHWRGPLVVTRALRDAGMEVIFGGKLKSSEIAEVAIQEDVDVIGLNLSCSVAAEPVRDLVQLLEEKKVRDILIVAGGTIPPEDIPLLKDMGVAEAFLPGSSMDAIVKYIREHVAD